MSASGAEVFASWSDVVARREWEVGFARERLEKMEPVDLPLCRMERVGADERTVRFGLKRGKLLYIFKHPTHDVERDKHRNVITRARFLKQRLESAGFRLIPWDFKKGQPPRFWDDAPMEDDDDDLYGPSEPRQPASKGDASHDDAESSGDEPMEEESADDADSDESDSDLEIIIDKPAIAPKPAQHPQQQPQESRAIKIEAPPQASAAPSQTARTTAPPVSTQPGTAYPAIKSSTIDVHGDPVYPPAGKPISHVVMDADLAEESKPWRLPGADQSDYFNYGFDEFSWEQYRLKQQEMSETIADQKAQQQQMMAMMGGLPGPTGAGPPSAPAGIPGMPSEAEMMQMMQQMAAQGMDPTSMDFNQMMMQMSNGGGMGGFAGPAGNQGGFSGGHGGGGGGRGRGRGRGGW